jgi:hypothetical protein
MRIPCGVTNIVNNGYVWLSFEDGHLGTVIYNGVSKQLEFVGLQKFANISKICGVDDLSCAIVDDADFLTVCRVPSKVARGYGGHDKVSKYEVCGRIQLPGRIRDLVRIGEVLVYFTEDGTAGGIAGYGHCSEFRFLQGVQGEIRARYSDVIGFSWRREGELCGQMSVVDLDFLDMMRSMGKGMKIGDEEVKGMLVARSLAEKRLCFVF